MEVEASCDAVDVEDLASEEESWNMTTLQGGRVDSFEGDASAGDKLILKRGATCNLIGVTA